jgi:hypothetical protein
LSISAILSCLFRVFSTRAQWSVLDSALEIVRLAHAQGSVSIETALYDGLNSFVSATAKGTADISTNDGRRRTANQDENENGSGENQTELARFLQEAVLALFSHTSGDSARNAEPEALRKSRAGLGSSLVGHHAINAASRGFLASIFDTWLQSERSRPIRDELEKARDLNNVRLR